MPYIVSAIINEIVQQELGDGDYLPLHVNTWQFSSHCVRNNPQESTHVRQQTMSHN